QVFGLEGHSLVMFFLVADVLLDFGHAWLAHSEPTITLLPTEVAQRREGLVNPLRGPRLQVSQQISDSKIAREAHQHMHVLGHAIDRDGRAVEVFGDAAEEGMEPLFDLGRDPRRAELGSVYGMVEVLSP